MRWANCVPWTKRQSPLLRYEFEALVIDAKDALERGDPTLASAIWSRARALSPDMAMTFQPAVELLLRLQSDDEAETILIAGQKRHPRHPPLIEALAMLEFRRHNYAATLRYCAQLRRRTPLREKGYWVAADALIELDRVSEAEATLAAGIRFVDDNVGLKIAHARIPERSRNWGEALKRWTSVWNDFHHPLSLLGVVQALKNLGRIDEADRFLSEGLYRTAVNHELLIEFRELRRGQTGLAGSGAQMGNFTAAISLCAARLCQLSAGVVGARASGRSRGDLARRTRPTSRSSRGRHCVCTVRP